MSVHEKMTAIADAIREKTGGTEPLTLDGMAASVPDVYDAGAKSEYDRFWDAYQDGGNRKNYACAYAGLGWTTDNFTPMHDMMPTNAYMMFRENPIAGDLVAILDATGVTLDFSDCTNYSYLFMYSYFSRVGTLRITQAAAVSLFQGAAVKTIDKIILNSDGSNTFLNWFSSAKNLENVTFEGTIAQNGLNLQWSTKLSHDSIVGIINALSDSTAGLSVTLSETAVNNAFATEEWEALIAARQNWTINLV